MVSSKSLFFVLLAGALASGCATSVATDDNGDPNNNNGDDSAQDAAGGAKKDHNAPQNDANIGAGEAGDQDTGAADTATPDTSVIDGGTPDATTPDSTTPDANTPDTSTPDTGVDTGTQDTGVHDTGVQDTGVDTGTTDSGVVCHPTTPNFTPTYHAPATSIFSCSSAQVGQFYDACFGAGSAGNCTTWRALNGTCDSCLTGHISATGSSWGPIVQDTNSVGAGLNVGGCVALDQGSAGSTCAQNIQYTQECGYAACTAACGTTDVAKLNACNSEATGTGGVCAAQAAAEDSACANISSVCFAGATARDRFINLAGVFCN